VTIEALVLVFVETVRIENDGDRPTTREEVKAAYVKRQKAIAWLSRAGPLGAATGSLAGLYNDAAILCNVADVHRLNLRQNDLAAHVLAHWQVMPAQCARRNDRRRRPVGRRLPEGPVAGGRSGGEP
jgi:hypothetical protein